MCNPLAIGIGAQLGGMYLLHRSANKAKSARGAATATENVRQNALQDESKAAMLASNAMMDRSGGFDKGVADEAAGLGKYYGGDVAGALNLPSASSNAPKIVSDAFTTATNNADAFNNKQNAQLADLNSFGTYLTNRVNPQFSQSAATGQMTGNFMKGSAGALGAELEAANEKAYNPLAQLLMAGGQVGTNYGLYKGKA